MKQSEVRFGVVERVVARLPVEFHSRDVSEAVEVIDAHGRLASEFNYHAMIGKALSGARGRLQISEVAKNHRGRGSLWQKREGAIAPATNTDTAVLPAPAPVDPTIRDGHWRAVRAMAGEDFLAIVRQFEERPEIGGTYFRVVKKGFQPVDLHAASPKPLIGVGPAFPAHASPSQVAAELDARVTELLRKRETLARSAEKQIEARFVRSALNGGLRLDPLPGSLRLIAGQWRIDLGGAGRPLDLLAADIETRALVVIELKPVPDHNAVHQVGEYVAAMRLWAPDAFEFFAALGGAMARVYGCNDMPDALEPGVVSGLAAWPTSDGRFEVVPCP